MNFLTGFSLQAKLIALVMAIAASFYAGWTVKTWNVDHNTIKQVKNDLNTVKTINKADDVIQDKAAKKEVEIRYVYRDIKQRIENNENSDNVCFTPESLRLWNAAIAGADPHRQEPVTEARDTATAKDILRNASDNFKTCQRNNNKHNALIDKIESLEGKMCVCRE